MRLPIIIWLEKVMVREDGKGDKNVKCGDKKYMTRRQKEVEGEKMKMCNRWRRKQKGIATNVAERSLKKIRANKKKIETRKIIKAYARMGRKNSAAFRAAKTWPNTGSSGANRNSQAMLKYIGILRWYPLHLKLKKIGKRNKISMSRSNPNWTKSRLKGPDHSVRFCIDFEINPCLEKVVINYPFGITLC